MGSQFQISDKSCCSDWQSFPSSWRIRDCAWNWATSMHFKFTNQWHLRQIPSYNPSSATCILHMYKQLHVSYIQTTTCFICTNSYMFHMHKQLHVSYVQTATSFICTHSYTFHMYKQLHVSYVQTATCFNQSDARNKTGSKICSCECCCLSYEAASDGYLISRNM